MIDGYLDTATSGALMAHADCYISLHRAEGLGLTMAEAMSLGKPVIATAYSGNMDFMTPETPSSRHESPRRANATWPPASRQRCVVHE